MWFYVRMCQTGPRRTVPPVQCDIGCSTLWWPWTVVNFSCQRHKIPPASRHIIRWVLYVTSESISNGAAHYCFCGPPPDSILTGWCILYSVSATCLSTIWSSSPQTAGACYGRGLKVATILFSVVPEDSVTNTSQPRLLTVTIETSRCLLGTVIRQDLSY